MARNDKNEMIGFDPLAWMDGNDQEESQVTEKLTDSKIRSLHSNQSETITLEQTAYSEEQYTEQNNLEMVMEDQQNLEVPQLGMVELEAEMNIQKVADLHKKMIDVLESNDQIDVNASGVKTVDTATLQLLLVFKQEAIKLHKNVVITASDQFVDSAKLLGLAEMLEVG